MNIFILSWVRVDKYCYNTGDTKDAVMGRIYSGAWAANKHYKRTGPRTLWINQQEVDKWISLQPHVEAAACPPGLSQGRVKTGNGSA